MDGGLSPTGLGGEYGVNRPLVCVAVEMSLLSWWMGAREKAITWR